MTPVAPEETAEALQGREVRAATKTAVAEDPEEMQAHNVVILRDVETTVPEAPGKTSVEAPKVPQTVARTLTPVQRRPERRPYRPL